MATLMVSHARQVKSEDPDKNWYPDPPGRCWVWDWQHHTIKIFVKKPSKMPRTVLISRRRCGYMEKDLKCGTWNVQTRFNTTALISLLFQLKQYRLSVTALQETRPQQEGCNGYYITYSYIVNKNETENLGWHL